MTSKRKRGIENLVDMNWRQPAKYINRLSTKYDFNYNKLMDIYLDVFNKLGEQNDLNEILSGYGPERMREFYQRESLKQTLVYVFDSIRDRNTQRNTQRNI